MVKEIRNNKGKLVCKVDDKAASVVIAKEREVTILTYRQGAFHIFHVSPITTSEQKQDPHTY